jgi:FG-GAP-like repeat
LICRRTLGYRCPSGAAMLGDGYIVRHFADGSLVLNDFHSDSLGASVTLAHVPAGPVADDRGIVYSVDPTGGDVAYVDAANSVHVIDPGVPRSAVAIAEMPTGTGFVGVGTGTGFPWNPVIRLNRLVSSWTVQVRKVSSGAVVFEQTGGSGVNVTPSWNGRLGSGAPAVSGQYTFSLSVTPMGESSPVTVPVLAGSKAIIVACGQAPFRSYDCDGAAALLAVKSDGEGHWFNATPTGSLADNGYTDNWFWGTAGASQVSAIVPFGDYNGDGLNDLIVRDGTGVLWAYDGIGQSYFGANTKQRIGSGWNAYNTLFSPGDLTGDGIADLVGRDTAGHLYLYKASGKSSFAARVLVGSGWSGYKTVIGAGDLNGDGLGDVLAIDTAGKLWFVPGRVNGIGSRTQVGTGWSSFNAVIGAGDVNDDGHNDLVARNSSGVLLLYRGVATGRSLPVRRSAPGSGRTPDCSDPPIGRVSADYPYVAGRAPTADSIAGWQPGSPGEGSAARRVGDLCIPRAPPAFGASLVRKSGIPMSLLWTYCVIGRTPTRLFPASGG